MQDFSSGGASRSVRRGLSAAAAAPLPSAALYQNLVPGSTTDPVEQARILALLYEIAQDLASILDLDDLLRTAGERIRHLVNYDTMSIMLFNTETQRLEHAFSLRYDERIQLHTTLGLGEGLCGTAAYERKPVRVNAVDLDPRYIRCEAGLAIESELVVPLIAKDRLLGVLDLESLQSNGFTEGHEIMLATLASTLAVALENARLYDELKRTEQRLTRDLERAREVQRALLPGEIPKMRGIDLAARYLPALEVGGDFYDFLPYGQGRLAIAVGDVSGKGSAAALLAALGIGLLREHAAQHPCTPEDMLAEINRHLQMTGMNGQFVAMAFAVYDEAQQELRIANAGLPPPVLVRNGVASTLAVRGVPLGLFPATDYELLQLQLRAGDIVAFCSDGIHEQTNTMEEEFGIARLLSQLAGTNRCCSAEEIAEDILGAAMRHAGARADCDECKDDRTVVVLRVEDAD